MCHPVREHRFRSCHTIYSVHLSMGDILDHPTLRRRVRALRRLRRPLQWAMPLSGNFAIQATSLLQSSLNSLSCIFFSAPFFQRGLRHLISRERRIAKIILKTARANYPKNAGDYPIAIHHPWHVTSSVDAAGGGGQQWLMTAARREI